MNLSQELETIANRDDFDFLSGEILKRVSTGDLKADFELVKQIIDFIENHPKVDFGIPGSMARFAERFPGPGYEPLLIESVKRNPNVFTLSMLNRLINGADNFDTRRELLDVMKSVLAKPDTSKSVLELGGYYLEMQKSWEIDEEE